MSSSAWWKEAVFYQIYPRSFQDSNGDGIGDLPGITQRLSYFRGGENSLGIDALWISPFYPSPMIDFGYDISNYTDVDSIFGSLEDFKTLLAEAKRLDIKVIIDLVINHTSDQHPWFLEARTSKDNPKRNWYVWHPGQARTGPAKAARTRPKRPSNWISMFELRNAWWWEPTTKEYYYGSFTRNQPEVNWRNAELRRAMYDVMRFWLDLGADGYRIDVVNWFMKDDQFRDNPFSLNMDPDLFQKHVYDRNRPETHDICREMRQVTEEYTAADGHNRVLVGEVFDHDPTNAAAYQNQHNQELHLAFNFDFLAQPWKASRFYNSIRKWYNAIGDEGWPNFTLSNHDRRRHYGRYRKPGCTAARARVAATMLLSLRGTPFLYYGEEIGMNNLRIHHRELQDPLGIRMWPLWWYGRDPERTPMQWDSTPHGGFCQPDVRPWLRVHHNYVRKNVAAQQRDPKSLWRWYQSLISLRKSEQLLRSGDIEFLRKGKGNLLAYRRYLGSQAPTAGTAAASGGAPPSRTTGQPGAAPPTRTTAGSILVVLNFGLRKFIQVPKDLANLLPTEGAKLLLGTHAETGTQIQTGHGIAPHEVLILQLE